MQINKDLRVTDGAYYNLDLDTIAKSGIYSTDEICIGRWINGKPLYRRCYYLTNKTVTASGTGASIVIGTRPSTMEVLTRFDGAAVVNNGSAMALSHSGFAAYQLSFGYYNGFMLEMATNGTIYLYWENGGSNQPSKTFSHITVILEYTKITD